MACDGSDIPKQKSGIPGCRLAISGRTSLAEAAVYLAATPLPFESTRVFSSLASVLDSKVQRGRVEAVIGLIDRHKRKDLLDQSLISDVH